MHNYYLHIIRTSFTIALAWFLAACRQAEVPEPANAEATIVLSLGDVQPYTELQTRSEQAVTDIAHYTFTISGTTISGVSVTDVPLVVGSDGKAEVNAGTYTLTASNRDYAETDFGRPYYSGTSEPFTIAVNETQNVTVALGKPQNARLTLAIDESFSALYSNPSLTLSNGNRTLELTTETECYFTIPASGALSYTISATALAGSHVTDIVGVTGYVDVQNGYNTTICLKADPATGIIIPVTDGEYSGTFDVRRR